MNYELNKLKFNCLLNLICIIIFFITGTIFTEAGKSVGGLNPGTTIGFIAYCVMFICLATFSYNLVSLLNKFAKEKKDN